MTLQHQKKVEAFANVLAEHRPRHLIVCSTIESSWEMCEV